MIVETTDNKKQSFTYCDAGCTVTMDTSANTISGPASIIRAINIHLHAKEIFPTWPYKFMVIIIISSSQFLNF